ncbi:MAG: glycosyltransferase family 4 protein [Bacteriodetes bacterium]|nr:glycosyltransferase family 4 protein [Bacteroidota bacterium]
MKNLLIVAYYFPPSGGPGVQRVLKNVQYLPQFGWNPIVLTVSNGTFPARDESLLAKIPPNITVVRTHIYEPYDLYRTFVGEQQNKAIDVSVLTKDGSGGIKKSIAEFIRATFFIPDARIGWMFSAVKAGKQLIKEHNISAIYSSSPPYTCSLIGRALKRSTGLPWIAGLRDPWTEFLTTPKRWFLPAMIDRHLEHSVLKEADYVECAWEGIITDARRKYPELPREKFLHVPNGYDSADFPEVPKQENQRFTITYSGSLYGLRNPYTLLQALELAVKNNSIDVSKILFRIVGRVGDDVKQTLEQSILRDSIEIIPYVPHGESIAYLMKSDMLLLIVDDTKESNEIVPGKVYEYIGVMKPVLALAPNQSAVAKLLRETNAGVTIELGDVTGCVEEIVKSYALWNEKQPLYHPHVDLIQRYERRESARELANTLDKLTT